MTMGHDEKLSIQTTEVSGHKIMRVAGQIDSVTALRFEKHLLDTLGQCHRLGVDCSALDYVSSAGIRVLLTTAKRIKGLDGRFEMFALTPMMSRMIEISCLTSVLSIHASEEDALAALARE